MYLDFFFDFSQILRFLEINFCILSDFCARARTHARTPLGFATCQRCVRVPWQKEHRNHAIGYGTPYVRLSHRKGYWPRPVAFQMNVHHHRWHLPPTDLFVVVGIQRANPRRCLSRYTHTIYRTFFLHYTQPTHARNPPPMFDRRNVTSFPFCV